MTGPASWGILKTVEVAAQHCLQVGERLLEHLSTLVSLWFRAISRREGSESPGALSFSYIQSKADFSSLKEAQQKFRAGYWN